MSVKESLKEIFKDNKIQLIVLLLLLIGVGVFKGTSTLISVDVPKEVEKYCSDKYGGDYTWGHYDIEKSDENSKYSWVKDSEGIIFGVLRYYTEGNEIGYRDNYLGYKYKKYFEDIVKMNILKDTTSVVSIENSNFPIVEDANISVNNFANNKETVICIEMKASRELSLKEMEVYCRYFKEKFRVIVKVDYNGTLKTYALNSDYDMIVR